MKINLKFPRTFKNWFEIIAASEQFLKIHGFTPFVTPANVDDFISDPELSAELKEQLIIHIAQTLDNHGRTYERNKSDIQARERKKQDRSTDSAILGFD